MNPRRRVEHRDLSTNRSMVRLWFFQLIALPGVASFGFTSRCPALTSHLVQPTKSRAAELRASGGALVPNDQRPPSTSKGMSSAVQNLRGLWKSLVKPSEVPVSELTRFEEAPEADSEFVPLVLVIGATGRMGRLIVRKLVLQGFRVSVLVRSLSSETLNLLGSGVSYSYGDMTDYRSLLDAMEDVDRVIFAADAEDDEELDGLQAVLRSFQDTRTFMYGDAESTKLSLFKMRRDRDFNRWRVEASSGDIASRLSSAGVGPKPSTVLWKRSGAHRNGVFVGRVFDTYLGAAVIGCSLSGLLLGATPVTYGAIEAAAPASLPNAANLPASESVERRVDVTDGKAYTRAEFVDEYGGTRQWDVAKPAPTAAAAGVRGEGELDRVVAAAAAAEVPLNLGEYSGLVIRAISDGKKYTAVLRTPEYARSGLEFHADFTTVAASKRFDTVRLPFSTFVPVRDGRRVLDAPELDRRQLVGLALAFYPQRNNPSQTTGEFYLSVANVKAFRKRDEPEMIYISDAEAAAGDSKEDNGKRGTLADAEAAAARAQAAPPISARAQVKLRGERMLRSSGLTYFIVRPTQLTDAPSSRRLSFTQGSGPVTGTVSRADVAEVAVRSLLDPRACNVACTITESDNVAPSMYEQDISKALEVLQPNR